MNERFAFLFGEKELTKRESSIKKLYIRRLLSLINTVFVWENLPDDIPAEYIENTLLLEGVIAFTPLQNKMTALAVSPYGVPNKYFIHDTWLYVNPYLPDKVNSGNVTTGKDCIVVYNDSISPWLYTPTRDLLIEYSELLAAVDISLKIAIKNTRLSFIGKATSNAEVSSYRDMIDGISQGATANVVLSNTTVSDGITTLPTVPHGVDYIRQLSECREYLLNAFLSNFGVATNTNLKRERALTTEINLQLEKPTFSIYSMLKARQEGAKKINEKYGTDIKVLFNPVITRTNDENGNFVPDEIENKNVVTLPQNEKEGDNIDTQTVIQSSDDPDEQSGG